MVNKQSVRRTTYQQKATTALEKVKSHLEQKLYPTKTASKTAITRCESTFIHKRTSTREKDRLVDAI